MSEISTTIKVNGETVEANSIRAWEIARSFGNEAFEQLQAINRLGLRDDLATFNLIQKALSAVGKLNTRTGFISEEARRRERLGASADEALAQGITERNFAEGRK